MVLYVETVSEGYNLQLVRPLPEMQKGLHAINKHETCAAVGPDISALVLGSPIEFKRTIPTWSALQYGDVVRVYGSVYFYGSVHRLGTITLPFPCCCLVVRHVLNLAQVLSSAITTTPSAALPCL